MRMLLGWPWPRVEKGTDPMRKMVTVGVVAVAALMLTTTASAITNGEPDGNAHPFVGALLAPVAYSDGT